MVIPKTYGRMGNFLFQAACAIGYAHDHNLQFSLPTVTNDAFWNPVYLQHLVNSEFRSDLPVHVIKEQTSQEYSPLPFENSWLGRNIVLDGYWQDQRYFGHIRSRIIELFGFRWNPKPNHISVHVRRGDYLTIRRGHMLKHPPVTKEWIETQMRQFDGARFVFFSDDLKWCEENFRGKDCVFHRGPTEVDDLVAMTWCEHHICSASTFSWWGAWLNRSEKKRVIMPRHWLTPGWSNFNTTHIVPQEWERA
jgi:hypothetical protein